MKHLEPLTDLEFYGAIGAIVALVLVGGTVAGLTIGLMSLDSTNLAILKLSGSVEEKVYASKIEPIRKNGHVLLVTLLIINAAVNETLPILFDYIHYSGLRAVLFSTLLILIFGEIIPQAICSRYGLRIGAMFVWPVRILITIFYPITYPIAALLDYLLGHAHGMVYRHAELKELVTLHGEDQAGPLSRDEVSVLKAVLDLRYKTVRDIMTSLDDVFMLPVSGVLDAATLNAIMEAGHSRIPIYTTKGRMHISGVVLVKQLLLNKGENVPIKDLQLGALPRVVHDLPLFEMLHIFQCGGSHLAAVVEEAAEVPHHRAPPSPIYHVMSPSGLQSSKDTNYTVLGIVTLEDVIEELLGEEIIDETDVYIDMSSKVQVPRFSNGKTHQEVETGSSWGSQPATMQFLTQAQVPTTIVEEDEEAPLLHDPKVHIKHFTRITLPKSVIFERGPAVRKRERSRKKPPVLTPAEVLAGKQQPVIISKRSPYISRTESNPAIPSNYSSIDLPHLSLDI